MQEISNDIRAKVFDIKYLQNRHWKPEPKQLGDSFYDEQQGLWEDAEKDVVYKNVILRWDSCDCGGEYGCNHPNYVYRIDFLNQNAHMEEQDDNNWYMEGNNNKHISTSCQFTMGDFERFCELLEIKLETKEK